MTFNTSPLSHSRGLNDWVAKRYAGLLLEKALNSTVGRTKDIAEEEETGGDASGAIVARQFCRGAALPYGWEGEGASSRSIVPC